MATTKYVAVNKMRDPWRGVALALPCRRPPYRRFLLALLLGACHTSDLPKASFTERTEPGSLVVAFDASSSVGAQTYLWDFGANGQNWNSPSCGDRCRRESPKVDYTYNQPGRYTVSLVVVDSNLSTSSTSRLVHAGNRSPTACFTVPPQAAVGDSVPFDASCSTDDDSLSRFDFNFGDNTAERRDTPQTTHAYTAPGSYHPTLVVTDMDNIAVASIPRSIVVQPKQDTTPPLVQMTLPLPEQPLPAGSPVLLQAKAWDDVSVTTVAFYLDDTLSLGSSSAGVPREDGWLLFGYEWTPSASLIGPHTLKARAYDSSTNSTDSKPLQVSVVAQP